MGTYLVICVGGGCGDAVAREATVSVERAARIVWFRGRNWKRKIGEGSKIRFGNGKGDIWEREWW